MTAYEPGPWTDFFVAVAGAAAALLGLIFVAVSLNHEQILKHPGLPPLAARSVAVLLGLALMCVVGLTPGQPPQALGAEVLALGIVLVLGVMVATFRGFDKDTPRRYKASLVLLALISAAPMVVAGLSTMLQTGGGLYWALAEVVCGLTVAVYYAWILLIEIRR